MAIRAWSAEVRSPGQALSRFKVEFLIRAHVGNGGDTSHFSSRYDRKSGLAYLWARRIEHNDVTFSYLLTNSYNITKSYTSR